MARTCSEILMVVLSPYVQHRPGVQKSNIKPKEILRQSVTFWLYATSLGELIFIM